MGDRVEIQVRGTPAARPRARHTARVIRGELRAIAYHPKPKLNAKDPYSRSWASANAWYDAVQAAVRPHLPPKPWTGPVRVSADIFFQRPQRLCRKRDPDGPVWHTATPDRDNLEKSITDALKAAGLFRDDSQVCDGPIRKFYAAKGCSPGVVIIAERIEEEAPCSS